MEIPKGLNPTKNPNDALKLGQQAGVVSVWAQNGNVFDIHFTDGEKGETIKSDVSNLVLSKILDMRGKPDIEGVEPEAFLDEDEIAFLDAIATIHKEYDLESAVDIRDLSDDDIQDAGIGSGMLQRVRMDFPYLEPDSDEVEEEVSEDTVAEDEEAVEEPESEEEEVPELGQDEGDENEEPDAVSEIVEFHGLNEAEEISFLTDEQIIEVPNVGEVTKDAIRELFPLIEEEEGESEDE